MIDENKGLEDHARLPANTRRSWRHSTKTAGLAAVFVIGAAAGAGAMRVADRHHPQAVMLLQPTAISTLQDATPVAIRGKVASVFGNAFVVEDGTGRALVDTGPRGGGRTVMPDETVTVQGRFDRGRLQAQVLTHADGRSEGFGPPKPPVDPRGPGAEPPSPPPPSVAPSGPNASR